MSLGKWRCNLFANTLPLKKKIIFLYSSYLKRMSSIWIFLKDYFSIYFCPIHLSSMKFIFSNNHAIDLENWWGGNLFCKCKWHKKYCNIFSKIYLVKQQYMHGHGKCPHMVNDVVEELLLKFTCRLQVRDLLFFPLVWWYGFMASWVKRIMKQNAILKIVSIRSWVEIFLVLWGWKVVTSKFNK
jgi:hypothetical protein